MKMMTVGAIVLCWGLAGCNEANFSQESQKKRAAQPEKLAEEARPREPVDCTGMTEKECHAKKEEAKTPDSFRTVDCRDKGAATCQEAIDKAKTDDGKENSEIRVINCSADAAALCAGKSADCTGMTQAECKAEKKKEKTPDSFRTVDCQGKDAKSCENAVSQALQSDGDEGSEIRVINCKGDDAACEKLKEKAKERDIDAGDGESKKKDKDIDLGDSVTLGSLKYCAGGPVNAVYAFKTEAEAMSCWNKVKTPGAFNKSKACAKCARVGKCSFKGSAEAARKKVRKLIAADCDCLTMDKATIPGISWDQAQPGC